VFLRICEPKCSFGWAGVEYLGEVNGCMEVSVR
jgi:hypothetical protein